MYCTPERQVALLRIILTLYRKGRDLIQAGVPLARLRALSCVPQVLRAKSAYGNTETGATGGAGTARSGGTGGAGKRICQSRVA